jgi:tape measure domain-containing protein
MQTLFDLFVRIQNENTAFNRVKANADNTFNSIDSRINKTSNAFANMGKNIAMMAGVAGMGMLIKGSFELAAGFEQTRVSFQTLLGDVDKGNNLFEDIRKMGAATPYQTDDLAKAAQTLLAFNVSGEKVLPTLSMLGDLAMGNAAKMQQISLVFGQIQSAGKLTGQDLLQLINVGINPLQRLSEKTGKSMGQLRDEMSKGLITSKMVTDAFVELTSEGGKFYQMSEKMSVTMSGRWSTLVDNVNLFRASLVETSSGAINNLLQSLNKIAIVFTNNIDKIQKFMRILFTVGKYFLIYKTTIWLTQKAMMAYNTVMTIVATTKKILAMATAHATLTLKAFRTALITTGIGVFIVALSAVASKLMSMREEAAETTEEFEGLNKELYKFMYPNNAEIDITKQLKIDPSTLRNTMEGATNKQFEDIRNQLNGIPQAQIVPDNTPTVIDQTKKATDELAESIKTINREQLGLMESGYLKLIEETNRELTNMDNPLMKGESIKALKVYEQRLKLVQGELSKFKSTSSTLDVTPSKELNDVTTELSTRRNIRQVTINIGTIKAAETIEMNNLQAGSREIETEMTEAVLRATASYALQQQ